MESARYRGRTACRLVPQIQDGGRVSRLPFSLYLCSMTAASAPRAWCLAACGVLTHLVLRARPPCEAPPAYEEAVAELAATAPPLPPPSKMATAEAIESVRGLHVLVRDEMRSARISCGFSLILSPASSDLKASRTCIAAATGESSPPQGTQARKATHPEPCHLHNPHPLSCAARRGRRPPAPPPPQPRARSPSKPACTRRAWGQLRRRARRGATWARRGTQRRWTPREHRVR